VKGSACDYAWTADIVMLAPDPAVSELDMLETTSLQVARGSVMTDHEGSRRETLLVLPGTQATLVMPDGAEQPVDALRVHVTEYTVGERGPDAMPAELPPTTGYTYAVEYTAEEAARPIPRRSNPNDPLTLVTMTDTTTVHGRL